VIDPLDLVYGADFAEVVAKTLPGAPEQEAFTKFKKAYPSAAQMGKGFPPFGADALRFTLATFPPTNRRIALALKRLEGYRFFVNKIWNATRFSLEHLQPLTHLPEGTPEPRGFYNRYILSRLGQAARIANRGIEGFRVDEAANELYRFFWNDFCDWYVELTKMVFTGPEEGEGDREREREETRHTLAHVLETSLRLLHPLMPFVTEELWQRVPKAASRPASIALAPYPRAEVDGRVDVAVEREMDLVQAIIGAARTVRSEHEIKPAERVSVWLRVENRDSALADLISRHVPAIRALVKTAGDPQLAGAGDRREAGTVVTVVPSDLGTVEVLVGLRGLVPKGKELARIDRELKRLDKDLSALDKKLQSSGFVDRAPKEVVAEAHAQRKAMAEARERVISSRALADELED